jgi:hypothetical protein
MAHGIRALRDTALAVVWLAATARGLEATAEACWRELLRRKLVQVEEVEKVA